MQHCTYSTDCGDCVSYHDTLLSIEHVNLQFEDKVILRDVNAEIKDVQRKCHIQGQVVGFLGPSGMGKTQLFRIIAGLNKPSSGQVLVNSSRDPVRPGMVGVVPQGYTLFEHRKVLGNLMLGAGKKYKDEHEAEAKAVDLLKRFGLKDKEYSYPAQLSGGQRQRVAIIQQILCSDHFLLMDEPFSGLDPINVEIVCGIINDVSCLDELNTVIITSHDVSAVTSVADHLWLLGRDRAADGTVFPGARVQKVYDLVEMGLCWQSDIQTKPEFAEFVRKLKLEFKTL